MQKIQLSENIVSQPYISLIKQLALNEKLDFDTAKLLALYSTGSNDPRLCRRSVNGSGIGTSLFPAFVFWPLISIFPSFFRLCDVGDVVVKVNVSPLNAMLPRDATHSTEH